MPNDRVKDDPPHNEGGANSDLSFVDVGSDVSTSRGRTPSFFHHYRVLLWKSFLLRRREPWVIVGELLLPLLLIIVVVSMRFSKMPEQYPACQLVSQPLPSMGFLAYMKSLICNFNFSCSPHDVTYQSQRNLEPPWLELLSRDPGVFSAALEKLIAKDSPVDKRSTVKLVCEPEVSRLAKLLLEPVQGLRLQSLCMAPDFIRTPIILNLVETSFANALYPVPSSDSLSAISSRTPMNATQFANLLKAVTVFACGSDIGSNSYLEIVGILDSVWNSPLLGDASREATNQNQTACALLSSIFKIGAIQPWIGRIQAALQGHIFYYPNTTLVKSIVEKANTTAQMLARLQAASNKWILIKDAFFPDLFANSPLVKTIRVLAGLCMVNPALPADRRESCRKLNNLLQPNPTPGYAHWKDLIPVIDNVSGAFDDILNNCVAYDRFHGFSTNEEMMEALTAAVKANATVAAINFESTPTPQNPNLLSMQFRYNSFKVDGTFRFKVLDKYWSPEPRNRARDSMKYFTSGFIDLQDQIERAFISITTGTPIDLAPDQLTANEFLPADMQFVPGPCYQVDPMLRLFTPNIPMMVVIIWICSHVITVRAVVYEKELRLKEFTKVMGMSNAVHWLNWFTVEFIMLGSSSVLATLLLKFGQVYPHTEVFLLFSNFVAFILAILPQAFLISVFFTNANFGAVFAGIFYFIMFIPYSIILIYDLEFWAYLLIALSPQCCLAMTFSRLSLLEVQGFGGQWGTLWINNLSNDEFSVGNCMLMMLVDALLAWIGVWYFETVIPGAYGLSRKWYFPLQLSYWREICGGCGKRREDPLSRRDLQSEALDAHFHEAPSEDLSVGVSVRGLTKYFNRKKFVAVDNLWVDFYENQITAFLGHNGAGKTTTISILTGMYAASAGTAYIYEKDISTEMTEIRHHLGLCPQHNILFGKMTVSEHIRFYGALKGLSEKEIDDEVTNFLAELKLEEKAEELAKNLSGGQKRRLSIAAAFVGGSKIVFLDEPTAGVDPSSRRDIWNLIFRFKSSRTIILTTHHMDEADVLGDRIAIISQGRLKASGSTLFLKSNFAKNYYLSMEKSDDATSADDTALVGMLSERLPGSKLVASNPTEWIFTLPAVRAFDVDGFAKLFAYLEENKKALADSHGVKQVGLTDTTLEEIFILLSDDPSKLDVKPHVRRKPFFLKRSHRRRLGDSNSHKTEGEENHENHSRSSPGTITDTFEEDYTPSLDKHTGSRLYLQQARAYFLKRLNCVRRSKRGWLLEVAAPALTVIILMVVVTTYPINNNQESMPLHPWLMANKKNIPHLETFFAHEPTTDVNINQVGELYSRQIASPVGWSGTRCLPESIYKLQPEKFDFCNRQGYVPPNPLPSLCPSELERVKQSVNVSCSCTAGEFSCPVEAVITPPSVLLPSTDYLNNLQGYNVSDYLLKSRNTAILKRYGGLEIVPSLNPSVVVGAKRTLSNDTFVEDFLNNSIRNPDAVAVGMLVAGILRDSLPPTHYARLWYHNKGWVSSTAYLNVLHNLQFRMLLAKKGVLDTDNYGMAVATNPLPLEDGTSSGAISNLFVSLMIEIFKSVGVILALSFIPASFASFIIRERQSGAKALQLLSGQSRFIYWSMSYLWDFVSFLIPIIIIIIIFLIFNEEAYIGRNEIGAFIALVLFYGLAIIPLMYIFTFVFRVPSIAFVTLLAMNLMIAILTTITVYMLELIEQENADVAVAKQVLVKLFLIFPQFAFGRGFFDMAKMKALEKIGITGLMPMGALWDWDVIGDKLAALGIEAMLFCGIVLLIEYATLCNCCPDRRGRRNMNAAIDDFSAEITSFPGKNDDVLEERERVLNDPLNSMHDVVRVVGLTKYYSNKRAAAVHDLTFGVRPGECFGLLGVNGAGKTTTFNMLTTNIHPTEGTITVGDCDLANLHRPTFNELIGYCPQFDALHTHLTGYETLQLYARIRGYPEHAVSAVANRLLDRLSIRPHAHKPVYTYSGGNLRKLSTAVATIGCPQVLLLDEPTSGMDPGAKRYLWQEIRRLLKEGCSVILTSHSMEECEVLCNRLAIMVDGQFQCFGTVQHLKQRFGEGYVIEVDLVDENATDPSHLFDSAVKTSIKMTESVGKRCNFEAKGEVQLSWLFKHLVSLREEMKISTFAVRQASLDNVFVNFVRQYGGESNEGTNTA